MFQRCASYATSTLPYLRIRVLAFPALKRGRGSQSNAARMSPNELRLAEFRSATVLRLGLLRVVDDDLRGFCGRGTVAGPSRDRRGTGVAVSARRTYHARDGGS